MRPVATVVTSILLLANACSPGTDQANGSVAMDENLRCAGVLNAAMRLMTTKAVPLDTELNGRAYEAAMRYITAYGLANHLAEREAFAAVEAERARVTASTPPEQIVADARTCADR
jgi:hypothetical protein